MLSALAHGKGEHGHDIAIASLAAVDAIDEERRSYYTRIVLAAVSKAVRRRLEEEMRLDNWPEPTDLEKRILARGEARGILRARAEGIFTVLAARSIDVSDDARARIAGCAKADVLDRWLTRAVTADRVEQLFDEADG